MIPWRSISSIWASTLRQYALYSSEPCLSINSPMSGRLGSWSQRPAILFSSFFSSSGVRVSILEPFRQCP